MQVSYHLTHYHMKTKILENGSSSYELPYYLGPLKLTHFKVLRSLALKSSYCIPNKKVVISFLFWQSNYTLSNLAACHRGKVQLATASREMRGLC